MINNNKIGIVSIAEMQGLDFIIPDYQRGYRWEELQVVELLKDLCNFIENSRTGFYCLQPLVVKRSIVDYKAFYQQMRGKLDNMQDEPDPIGRLVENLQYLTTWEVIDGQPGKEHILALCKDRYLPACYKAGAGAAPCIL